MMIEWEGVMFCGARTVGYTIVKTGSVMQESSEEWFHYSPV